MAAPVGRLEYVCIDAEDAERLAAFWGAVLDVGVVFREGAYVVLDRPAPGAPALSFQRVPEAKSVKNRVHLDLRVADVEAATARVQELGAKVLRDVREHGGWFRVMADPEGNELCLLSTLGSQPW